ncbi:metallophosphoesterase family protein [bacterium]|nr:metallophosphoesterase family protein [bacterium]
MAKYAIFSDVHANWEALGAVYQDFHAIDGLTDVISLGDLVGYGPNPNEVVGGLHALTKKGYRLRCCLGNHDAAAIGRFHFVDLRDDADRERLAAEAGLDSLEAAARHFQDVETRKYVPVRFTAKASIGWTQKALSDGVRSFLQTKCPDHFKLTPDILCLHGSPADPLFGYITSGRRAQRAFEAPLMSGVRLCLHGHSHIAGMWQLGADDVVSYAGNVVIMNPPRKLPGTMLKLDLDSTITLVNVGSVGQPRDGDGRAAYCVFDDEALTIEIRRVAYDIATTRKKIVACGLPKLLADRLGQADAQPALDDDDVE